MVSEAGQHLNPRRHVLHDFVLLFDVADGNLNGDPDAGNLPWVDMEHLETLSIPGPDMQRLDRLARRRDRLAKSIGNRKTRIAAYLAGLFRTWQEEIAMELKLM